jgi:hypothetical protein
LKKGRSFVGLSRHASEIIDRQRGRSTPMTFAVFEDRTQTSIVEIIGTLPIVLSMRARQRFHNAVFQPPWSNCFGGTMCHSML